LCSDPVGVIAAFARNMPDRTIQISGILLIKHGCEISQTIANHHVHARLGPLLAGRCRSVRSKQLVFVCRPWF
jgi:hypothetical protein